MLYAYLDGEIRDVAHLTSGWSLAADRDDWRELAVEGEDVRLVFDGRRYIQERREEPTDEEEEEPREKRIVFEQCGEWECCVTGDVLAEDVQLFERLEADLPTINVTAGTKIDELTFLWVFDDLVEAEILTPKACERLLNDEDFEYDDSDIYLAYILNYTEENGVSLWRGGWSQTNADCVLTGGQSGSTAWASVSAGEVRGYLPLHDLLVEEPEKTETNDVSDPRCVFGERRLY